MNPRPSSRPNKPRTIQGSGILPWSIKSLETLSNKLLVASMLRTTMFKMKRWNGPCGDPYCHRGAEGYGFAGGAGRYKDGPCEAIDCKWPKEKDPPDPHM